MTNILNVGDEFEQIIDSPRSLEALRRNGLTQNDLRPKNQYDIELLYNEGIFNFIGRP